MSVTWTQRANVPAGNRKWTEGESSPGDAWLPGGAARQENQRYDAWSNSWNNLTNCPSLYWSPGVKGGLLQGICFFPLITGGNAHLYNTLLDSWDTTSVPSLSDHYRQARAAESSNICAGGEIRVGGVGAWSPTRDVWLLFYDPSTMTWQWIAQSSMPVPGRWGHGFVQSGGSKFSGYGFDGTNYLVDMDRLGIAWVGRTDSPGPGRREVTALKLGYIFYFTCGQNATQIFSHTTVYDDGDDTWFFSTNRPTNAFACAGAFSDTTGYVYAGDPTYTENWEIDKPVPEVEFREFDPTGTEPNRVTGGEVVDDLDNPMVISGHVAFYSSPNVYIFRQRETNYIISQMKIYLEAENFESESTTLYGNITDDWTQKLNPEDIPSGEPGVFPTSIPDDPNITKIGGGNITDNNQADTSQYVENTLYQAADESQHADNVGNIQIAFQFA